jgi:hypothetical protein
MTAEKLEQILALLDEVDAIASESCDYSDIVAMTNKIRSLITSGEK